MGHESLSSSQGIASGLLLVLMPVPDCPEQTWKLDGLVVPARSCHDVPDADPGPDPVPESVALFYQLINICFINICDHQTQTLCNY